MLENCYKPLKPQAHGCYYFSKNIGTDTKFMEAFANKKTTQGQELHMPAHLHTYLLLWRKTAAEMFADMTQKTMLMFGS